MIKHIIAIVLLSILVVLAMPHMQALLQGLLSAEYWVADTLKAVFSGGTAGNITRELIALLVIPFLVGLVPALIYWLAKRRWFPYFMHVVWIVWLVETAALIISHKGGTI